MTTTPPKAPPHHQDAPRHTKPAPAPKPAAWRDWDFWRFVLAALSLAWEIAKTWVR